MSKANRNRRVRDRRIKRVWAACLGKTYLLFYTTPRILTMVGPEGISLEDFDYPPRITGLSAFPPDGFPEDSAITPTGDVFHDYGTISREGY